MRSIKYGSPHYEIVFILLLFPVCYIHTIRLRTLLSNNCYLLGCNGVSCSGYKCFIVAAVIITVSTQQSVNLCMIPSFTTSLNIYFARGHVSDIRFHLQTTVYLPKLLLFFNKSSKWGDEPQLTPAWQLLYSVKYLSQYLSHLLKIHHNGTACVDR
jgi:hypothetical protein